MLLINKQNQSKTTTIMFEYDWFTPNIPIWDKYKPLFFNKPNMNCLEIGSFEGRSTIYTAENYCNGNGSYVDALDTWGGSIEHTDQDKIGLYDRFVNNLKTHIESQRIHIYRDFSSNSLMKFVQEVKAEVRDKYNFIYVDASHTAKDVLMDAILSWELLKVGGVMIFDDYEWTAYHSPEMTPKPAIDGFLASYSCMYKILYKGRQVHIIKISDDTENVGEVCLFKANTLLFDNTALQNVVGIERALINGADINYIHFGKYTALYWAAQEKYLDSAKILLDSGGDTEIKAANNETPLTISVLNNDFNMTKLLIEKNANIETSNGLGSTPLYLAVYFGYDDILQLLLDNGANKDVQVAGMSAFYRALQNKHISTAQLLAGSIDSFCQQINSTEYEVKYVELCGNNENSIEL